MAIVLVGIFLRTYSFHNWLLFEADQVRDATLVEQVIKGETAWPQFGPTMRKSGISEDKLFKLGPIYYYFQIVSVKLFGNVPVSLAYPDLLFSILTIPLFYYFLRRYFQHNFSLAATGILAISFFAIQYSRFAWNSNSIPFFVLLFLLALHEFLVKKEKVAWGWATMLGIAIGAGVQLHAILIVLFLTTTFCILIFSMRQNWRSWNKWALVFLVVLLLNAGQLIADGKNNFTNVKAFVSFPAKNKQVQLEEKILNFAQTVSCNFEANTFLLLSEAGTDSVSAGSASCNFDYLKDFGSGKFSKILKKPAFWFWIVPRNIFSIFGYLALVYFFFKEKEEKRKNFLGLIILFLVINFFVMLAINSGGFKEFRYFIQVFFVPFILLGLLLNFLRQKNTKARGIIFIIIFVILAIFNLNSLWSAAGKLQAQEASDNNSVFLGEAESMVAYLGSEKQSEIYLAGEKGYLDNFFKPLSYLAKSQKFDIIRIEDETDLISGKALFFLKKNEKTRNIQMQIAGRKIKKESVFGQLIIYNLEN